MSTFEAGPDVPDGTTPATPETIVVLTEVALRRSDVERMIGLHDQEQLAYRVLVPADTEHNVLVDLLDHLTLLDLKSAVADLRGTDRTRARSAAADALAESVAAIEAAGRPATGVVTEDDPLPALRAEIAACAAREVVVVTEPHAVEDTFHTDWASRAREEFGLPVLHMYAGDWRLG